MRFVSSPLPKAAIEVASLSKYVVVAILITFEKTFLISWIHRITIVSGVVSLLREIPYHSANP